MFVEKPKEEVYDVIMNEVGSLEITVDVLGAKIVKFTNCVSDSFQHG